MRSIALYSLGTILGILTLLMVLLAPFWISSVTAQVMMQPGNAYWWIILLFASAPYLLLLGLWFLLWLSARLTRSAPAA